MSLGKRECRVESNNWVLFFKSMTWSTEGADLYNYVMFCLQMLGSRETGKNFSKYWNVYCELVLRLIWKDNWCVFFFYLCMNVNIIISCLILFVNFYLFLLFSAHEFQAGLHLSLWTTCWKMNKCWWHALQNVTKKNTCAFCIKLFRLCVIVFRATIEMTLANICFPSS